MNQKRKVISKTKPRYPNLNEAKMSRRDLLGMAAGTALLSFLTACGVPEKLGGAAAPPELYKMRLPQKENRHLTTNDGTLLSYFVAIQYESFSLEQYILKNTEALLQKIDGLLKTYSYKELADKKYLPQFSQKIRQIIEKSYKSEMNQAAYLYSCQLEILHLKAGDKISGGKPAPNPSEP